MGQYFRINGDYNIKVKDGSKIVLDTGSTGEVVIDGDLVVTGETTAITTEDLKVEDNIITLNVGGGSSDGSGILPVLRYSGIEVDRGTTEDSSIAPRASILFDEFESIGEGFATDKNPGTWIIADRVFTLATTNDEADRDEPKTSLPTTILYNFENSNLKLRRILTDTTYPDLILVGYGTGVVTVKGTSNYTNEILSRTAASDPEVDDILTNKGYVDYSILNNPTFQIRAPGIGTQGDTRVVISDANIGSGAGSPAYLFSETGYNSGPSNNESSVTFVIDGRLSAQLFKERLELPGLVIFDESYTNTGNPTLDGNPAYRQDAIVFQTQNTNGNIKLEPNGTGRVEITWAMQYDHANSVVPAYVDNATLIYADPESTGDTGLFFVTENDTRGEFISKNRALLFSMLF